MQFADPKNNVAFKKIFGDENKKEILISFINAVLDLREDRQIKEIEIIDSYQAPKIEGLKYTILDVKAKDKKGNSFIIEMQVEKQEHFGKRALYYTSKAYVNQIKKAVKYLELKPVIFIGILNFNLFENKNYLSKHLILNLENQKQEIKDFEFNFIELKKFNKNLSELSNIVDKWTYFIKNAENLELIPKELSKIKEIKEAFEVANQHTWTEKELEVYDFWQMQETGHIDAL